MIEMEAEKSKCRKIEAEVKLRNEEIELEESKYEKEVVERKEVYLQRKIEVQKSVMIAREEVEEGFRKDRRETKIKIQKLVIIQQVQEAKY